MPPVACPRCRKKLRVPEHLAGKKVTCPRCDEVLHVPVELPEQIEAPAVAPASASLSHADEPLPWSVQLGVGALMLGLGAILSLCLPVLGGYASIGMSVLGLLAALYGLYHSRMDRGGILNHPVAANGVGIIRGFGTRAQHYPLAGIGVCLFALILTLLPRLFR